jgi:hypothetical protein
MPRPARSTRNSVKKKKDDENKVAQSDTTNIKPTSTNSTRDPSVDNYKLHFELTDLEPTKSTIPQTDKDVQGVHEQEQGGGVGEHREQGSTVGRIESDPRVHEDRDGSGEPDHTSSNIDQPRVSQIQHDRFIPRSTSPTHKYPIDPHLSYLPQYLHENESASLSSFIQRA